MTDKKENIVLINTENIIIFLKKNVIIISACGTLFGLLGLFYSYLLPTEFTASVKILPELQSKSSIGGFRALADLAGINLDNMQVSEAIRPDLYPSVLESKNFLLNVSDIQIQAIDRAEKESLESFIVRQKSKIDNIKSILFGWMKRETVNKLSNKTIEKIPPNILFVSKEKEAILSSLSSRIKASLDKKTGIIKITVDMPDPVVAAWVAQYATDYLTDYMLEYRNNRDSNDARFLREQVNKAKQRFENAERNLRSYRDRNRNPFITGSTAEESQLQAELAISQNLYTELSRQMEQSNIKVNERKPILKVLESAQVPLVKSSPKRAMYLFVGIFIGVIFSILYSLVKYKSQNI